MKQLIFIFTVLFLVSLQPVQAQDDDLIDPVLLHLKGKLVSKDDGLPVSFAHIVNMRTHGGTTTDALGRFSMEVLNVDSLGISAMGYVKEYVRIPHFHNEDSVLVIQARPIRYAIGEVKVTGEANKVNMDGISTGKPVNISPELRGDSYNSKPPWYAAIFSPASFLQYHISRREKEKREVRAAMISDQQWEYLSQFYNKDMVRSLTGLNDQEADKFMIYFNSKSVLTARSTEYDVREAILKQYELYKLEQE
ncbi:MAG: hypothetical protein AB7U05_14115 [Mangrovibacterium sp.]